MHKINTKEIVTFALLMALTIVMTILVRIPSFHGYINLGDMVLLFAALFSGKKAGFFVGGLGSALADIIIGYAYYAPITFVVKGLQGYICGWIFQKTGYNNPFLAAIPAGIFMALGYFVAESFMYGIAGAAVSIPGNLLQGMVGALGAVLLQNGIGTKIKR